MHERLQSMSPTNKHQKQGKSLSRTISKTRNAHDDKQQINELEEKNKEVENNTKYNNRSYKNRSSNEFFFIEINGFYRRIKPKAHFKEQTSKTEEDIFQKTTQ